MSNFVPSGIIKLIKDVDIDVSYNHQYYFSNTDAQLTFFESKVFKTLTSATYQRKNINTIRVNYNADEIRECKYLYWLNGPSDKYYFAFVTSIDYENPKTSIIHYQLDVYQTYLFDMDWKASFIERQHCDRYYTVSGSTYPFKYTEPENLEYGSEYNILSRQKLEQIEDVAWMILGVTKFPQQLIPQFVADLPSGIYYIFVPVNLDQRKSVIFYNGSSTTRLADPGSLLNAYATNTDLVNSLVSCTIVPFLPFNVSVRIVEGTYPEYHLTMEAPLSTGSISNVGEVYTFTGLFSSTRDVLHRIEFDAGNKYDDFPEYEESKLLMYPYSFIELTNERGNSIPIKMEYIYSDNITIGAFGSINFVNKALYVIKYYLCDDDQLRYYKETGLVDSSNTTVPIINDYSASFLQSNSNALAVAESNAKIQVSTAYENAQRTYNTGRSVNQLQALGSLAQDLGGGADAIGNMFSSVFGAGSGVDTGIFKTLGNLINTETTYLSGGLQVETNLANSRNSALSDYMMSVESTLAKKRDAQQIPPSVTNMGGDYLFNIINDCNAIYLVKKTIMPEYANKLQDFFKQYGYKYNKLEVPQFHTRTSWNYIKMTQPNVSGNIPMDDLLAIKGIFQKGITLWHDDNIGNYSRNNNEI